MTALTATTMTTDELLALPDNGMERWLLDGQLQERPMTVRNRWHSRIVARVTKFLDNWLDTQPQPRGQILTGDAGFRLLQNPDTTVGIDVAYVSAEVLARQTDETRIIEGIPVLAVEVLSPSDTQENIDDKVDVYLRARVPLVWLIDVHDSTVLVYRPGAKPMLVNDTQDLSGEPELPGFRVAAGLLFG